MHVDERSLSIPERYHVRAGAILISLTGSHIAQPNSVVGRVARHSTGLPNCVLDQRAGKITVKDDNKCDLRLGVEARNSFWLPLTEMDYIAERAPQGLRAEHDQNVGSDQTILGFCPSSDSEEVDSTARKGASARLLAQVYQVDPLVCPECESQMKVIAVIQHPDEIKHILRHLIKIGGAPPGLDDPL